MTTKKAWTISIAASVLLVGLVFVGLFGAGLRFFVVKTPSMATTAPVGTLVVVRPASSYAIGDIISYQHGSLSITHRIVAQTWQGWITKGDLNTAADPLPVTTAQIIGKVVVCAKYVGFLVDALPLLLIGFATVWIITLLPRVRPSWRWQIRLVGWSLVASLVALFQRPWVNMVMIGYVSDSRTGVDMHLVNTGIFPLRVMNTVLGSGQDAIVNQSVADAMGRYSITPQLALNFWWFLTLVVICLAPTVAALFLRVGDPVEVASAPEPAEIPKTRIHRLVLSDAFAPALVVLVAIVAVSLVLQASTQSTYSSVIRNTNNTAGTRTWFTCQAAETGTANARFVWGLTAATATQTDLTSNGRNGTMTTLRRGTAATQSSSSPCPRDTQGSVAFHGATCYTQSAIVTATSTYSEEVWFNTTDTSLNGKLMGFASDPTPANQSAYDRHIYIDPTGRVVFGVYLTSQYVVSSPAGTNYANGVWHQVVATSSAGSVALYLDGALVASRSDTAGQMSYPGYWQVGCGLLADWQDASGTPRAFSSYFTGNLRLAAVYDRTLSATEVKEHYLAGTN